ncbi:signal transduction histidine kinase [Pedobacter sp. AK017]|uniref:sensor histidine kinase n=1 Tax=Pedobacter sp. AK017 TaxID=2723073 RepID=UPI00161309BF|nr:HAMP domain-containing sensor histidine kinase [Pedobacter sp. AK017]MBB5441010.1 signal transduction histidine kinase [Pedobacter sp. AK017]
MTEIITISLENEMDLVLAHEKSMKAAEKLGLTIATQTTFATAVSEVARTVIDYTNNGLLNIYIDGTIPRFNLMAQIIFSSEARLTKSDEGFYYAQKLVPEFEMSTSGTDHLITMRIGLPRFLKLDQLKINLLKAFFEKEEPINAYEQIKHKNSVLHKITGEQEIEIKREREINEKKNEFISIASHEIKTPITVIKAYAQMLKMMRSECSNKANEIIDRLNGQTNKLSYLANQLMDVSKVENGKLQYNFESTKINQFVGEVLSVLKHVYPGNELEWSNCEETEVNLDKLRMEQVLTNLIGNASKYSAPNSAIKITGTVAQEQIIIAVIDKGIGMSAENMERIFEKFYRNKEITDSHPGLGMGLYITSKIINDHGGKIWVESEQGKGSAFHFTIPLFTPAKN